MKNDCCSTKTRKMLRHIKGVTAPPHPRPRRLRFDPLTTQRSLKADKSHQFSEAD